MARHAITIWVGGLVGVVFRMGIGVVGLRREGGGRRERIRAYSTGNSTGNAGYHTRDRVWVDEREYGRQEGREAASITKRCNYIPGERERRNAVTRGT